MIIWLYRCWDFFSIKISIAGDCAVGFDAPFLLLMSIVFAAFASHSFAGTAADFTDSISV